MKFKPTEQELLNTFAQIKKQINVLEKQAEEYKPSVLEILDTYELGELEIGNDSITIGSRRTWKYSAELQAEEKAVKAKQKEEQRLKIADYKENRYPIFNDSDNRKVKEE
jgi:hypothetical protein